MSESVVNQVRTLCIGENAYETNLPEGVQPLGYDKLSMNYTPSMEKVLQLKGPLLPVTFDDIPVGSYWVRGTVPNRDMWWDANATIDMRRDIEVYATEIGKVVTRQSLPPSSHAWRLEANAASLMTSLGYDVRPEETDEVLKVAGIPTPQTVRKAAGNLGVEAALIPGYGLLPVKMYLETFAAGQYPISISTQAFYQHDIEDDHLLGIVMGGEPLRDTLGRAAAWGLRGGDLDRMIIAGDVIDAYSYRLRGLMGRHTLSGSARKQYNPHYALVDLRQGGKEAGITYKQTDAIVAHARKRAIEFGLEPL